MARIVVITTVELPEHALDGHVDSGDELIVVAPAVEQSRLQWLTNDEDDARARADALAASTADSAPAGEVAIEVTPEVPSQAVLDAIREHDPDRVVVALRTGDDATWMEDGELRPLPDTVGGVPITRIRV